MAINIEPISSTRSPFYVLDCGHYHKTYTRILMRNFDYNEQFNSMVKSATEALKTIFPIEGKLRSLSADKIWVEDKLDATNYSEQSKIKSREGTWGVPVYADLTLREKATGKVLDRAPKIKLFGLPKITDRFSYIVKGNEYQVTNQLRLKPGAYTLRKQNGELKTQVNLARGKNFDLAFNETSGVFSIQKIGGGQANIPLYPVMVYLGVSAQLIAKQWGARLEMANRNTDQKVLQRAAEAFGVKKGDLKSTLSNSQISPETTRKTLGFAFDRVDGPFLLAASKNLLDVHLGKKDPVDRDSLEFKELHSIEDFIHERIQKNKDTIAFKFSRNIDNPRRVKISQLLNPEAFNSVLESFFTQDDKSNTSEQTNPLEMLSGAYRVTIMGSGGIKSDHAITPAMREIHSTHYGFLDPIHSPESNVGVNMHIPTGAIKEGKVLKTIVVDKNRKPVTLTPAEAHDKIIAFPNQKGAMVKALHKGKVIDIARTKVDYFTPHPMALFSPSTNLIPYLQNDQGNRAMMASKMLEQAISLKHREVPLVQVGASETESMEEILGKKMAVLSPEAGKVKRITDDHIVVATKSGDKKLNLYNNFDLNRKSFLHHTPVVKVGDAVKSGQLLADSNYTRNGVLALGANLKTAFLPYRGLNFDDGIVITESASEKLTSEHIHKKSMDIDENTILNLVSFKSNYPNALTPANAEKLDNEGVIRKGTRVRMGEVLIAALRKGTSSSILALLSKGLANRPRDVSVYWPMEDDGEVIEVLKTKKEVRVLIKTEEKAKIGDKLTGRHGNKGVITHILPDGEAPRNGKGEPVEVLLNPSGVISRINIGQIYESAAGKVAAKTGIPHKTFSFSGNDELKATTALMKKHGVNDKEELFDASGKSIGKVHVGMPQILKLFKQSTGNFSVRQGGPGHPYDANMQPLKAGGPEASKAVDLLAMYCLLSHGARANLREISTLKGGSNDEFWKALKSGQPLPAPKTPFVYDKFIAYLRGAGIDVKKEGTRLQLAPLTDETVRAMSSGEIKKPVLYNAKDLRPKPGGLFDPGITGGYNGDKWSHMELTEPVLNPVFEDAAKKITGLGKKFDEILAGKLHVDAHGETNSDGKGTTGGAGIAAILKEIDVEAEISRIEKQMPRLKGTNLDDANKKMRYLRALKDAKLKPSEAYIRNLIPVVPTAYRPIYPMPNGNVAISDLNFLYQNTGVINTMMKLPVMKLLPEEEKSNIRADLYKHTKGLSGLTDLNIKGRDREGFISEIKGSQPKEGFFISKLLSKKQDFVGRGTAIPDSDLGIDELGVPEEMAWKLFEPFVIRELKMHGKTPIQALEEIKSKSLLATRALEVIMKERHVLLNRAPSLHKFSVMAFKPKIVSGRAIRVQPLINKGFNVDFDGDQQLTYILTSLPKDGISSLVQNNECIKEILSMSARYKEILPILSENDEVLLVHLEEFPHGELVKTVDGAKGTIEFYEALPGTKVISMDEPTGSLCWKTVSHWSKHLGREVEIVNLASGRQIFTDDDPRAVYGLAIGSTKLERFTPTEALDKKVMVPRSHRLSSLTQPEPLGRPRKEHSFEMGYILGALAGNGWVEHKYGALSGNIFLAGITDEVSSYFMSACEKLFKFEGSTLEYSRPKGVHNTYGESKKTGFRSLEAAEYIKEKIGAGARNKKLPGCFLVAPEPFRKGLLAGLMDTDGSVSISNAEAKNKPQLMANYTTSSIRLAQDILLLTQSLGIKGSISTTKTPAGEPFWICNLSAIDMKKWAGEGMQHPNKKAKLFEGVVDSASSSAGRFDTIPITSDLATRLTKLIGAPRNADKEQKSMYAVVHKAKTTGCIGRSTCLKMAKIIPEQALDAFSGWKELLALAQNTDITWDRVVSVNKTGVREDGYDLTVPGFETFMDYQGVVLSNTLVVHTPITDEANQEAEKMLPSRNLFQPGSGSLMILPSQEAQVGLYYLSNTPAGRTKLNKILPKAYQIKAVLDKKSTKGFLSTLAKNLPPNEYGVLVKELKTEGERHAYETGFTLGVNDLKVMSRPRDTLMRNLTKKLKGVTDSIKIKKLSDEYAIKTEALISKTLKNKHNPLYDMVASGSKGSDSNLRSILSTPVLVTDARGKIIPKPIAKSYSEGLGISDYWVSMYGARRGMMDRSIQTSLPGAFSKDIMATTVDNVISGVDCGTKEGIELPVDSSDALDRFLAGNQGGLTHNSLVDTAVISRLRKSGVRSIKVRSPLRCLQSKGTCSKCYGLDEHGHPPEVGDNIGAKAGQTLSEPLVQLVMNAFHTGGTATTKGQLGGFARINQLMHLPKIVVGAAALAPVDGKVTKIVPGVAGGFNITVGTQTVHAEQGLKLKVVVGQSVLAGDPLSEGTIKPQDLVKLKGMRAAQSYLSTELQKAYQDQGQKIHAKVFETVVRSLGNTTKIMSHPRDTAYLQGDIVPYTTIEHHNKNLVSVMPVNEAFGHALVDSVGTLKPGHILEEKDILSLKSKGIKEIKVSKEPILHAPLLKGMSTLPLLKRNWMANLGYRYLAKALKEGAGQGWTTDLSDYHPIPAFAHGETFGKGSEGKY